MKPVNVEVIVTDDRLYDFGVPQRGTALAAGYDLRALWDVNSTQLANNLSDEGTKLTLMPNESIVVDSGLRVHPGSHSNNIAALVLPRSGTGVKGLVVGNLVGLIDADYQGPLKVCLWNRSNAPIQIELGDRVAQLMFVPVYPVCLEHVTEFSRDTARGGGGFGSTGVK